MVKWGVRLIGLLFIFEAAWDLYILFTAQNNAIRFVGISGGIHYGDKYVEILAWIAACLFAYIGYRLLTLHTEGRTWALIILWPAAILSGISLALFMILPILSFASSKEISMGLYLFNNKLRSITNPNSVLLIIGLFFLFYAIQVWFLMRQDVKNEFQKPTKAKELT
ncbi:MAG: hypothetical protein IT315_02705 [Anaerolineales bacterium]|nr:hypothetical protein [Anaerolineales bacterium]